MMNRLTLPLDVMRFELSRSLTPPRIAVWLMLAAFPVAIIATMRLIVHWQTGRSIAQAELIQPFGFTLYFLVPEVSCLLGLLLWATPAVSTEVEGQTWVYLALRRSGRRMVLFGKYLTAVAWTLSSALVATALCSLIIGTDQMVRLWWVMSLLTVLSCVAHAAIFVFIGVMFFRRTMVAAVFYTVVVEYVLSFVPAVINRFTVNYRLRGLLADWMGWGGVRSTAEAIFGVQSAQTHLAALLVFTICWLGLALYRIGHAEYPSHQDG